MEGEAVFGEVVGDTGVQTEMRILAVASHSQAELLVEREEEDTEHLDKKELVLNSWLQ